MLRRDVCRVIRKSRIRHAFCIRRLDSSRVTGSGEIYLVRLKPRSGVTSGTSRIELVPFLANSGGTGVPSIATFITRLWLFPYVAGERGNVIQNADRCGRLRRSVRQANHTLLARKAFAEPRFDSGCHVL